MPDDLPIIAFATASELEDWLEENGGGSDGIWLKIAKKSSGLASVTMPEAIEVGLCFGWIDGQRRGLDETHYLQRFTPRRSRSRWSRINRDKAEELIAGGRMRPQGLAAIEAAKEDGRWQAAYEPQSAATVPADLDRELKRDPAAREEFERLDSQNRYAILYRLGEAKRPETRARRLREYVEMLRRGERLHP
jgi:uncharacterized protein YdeI (YjbR/CyaY-like superfamily)